MRKAGWRHCILMVLLASFGGGANEARSADLRDHVTVSAYCEKFARQYCEDNAAVYQEGSARTQKRPDLMMRIENFFQPPDSRFTAGYDCRFQARPEGELVREISVGVLLTGTLHFAEYTKWRELQIVPIEHVVDEVNGRTGYGVFKYLKSP